MRFHPVITYHPVVTYHPVITYHSVITYHPKIINHKDMINSMAVLYHLKIEINSIDKQITNKYCSKINRSCLCHSRDDIKSILIYCKRNNNNERADYNVHQIKSVHLVFPTKSPHQDYLVNYPHPDYHTKDRRKDCIRKL